MIPSKIYYAWFGDKPLPQSSRININGWKKLNPTFDIIEINKYNFDYNKYRFSQKAYKEKKWAFVSDVARLDTIYNNGGFYFDVDVELLKPIDILQEYKSVWAMENSDAINSGLVLGAEMHDKNIESILNIYRNKEFISSSYDSVCVPIVSNYFRKHGFKNKNKLQILADKTVILSSEFFAPYHYWGGGRVTRKTIGIHHYSANWDTGKLYLSTRVKREIVYRAPTIYYGIRDFLKK